MAGLRHLSSEAKAGERMRHDVRDWPVRTRVDDTSVGKVHDVLIDDGGNARYFEIELDGGRHVLMPAGDAGIDEDRRALSVVGLDRQGLKALPEYDRRTETIDDAYATRHATAFDSAWSDRHFHDRSDYRADWQRDTDREASGTIARLDDLDDVKVASHEPDPRGWEVVGANGRRIGKVDHLIGDTGAMKVRYLAVELADDVVNEDRQVLIPAGHVDLDRDGNRVHARSIETEWVRELPPYTGGAIGREYESDLRNRWNAAYAGERRYEHPRYRSSMLAPDGTRRAD